MKRALQTLVVFCFIMNGLHVSGQVNPWIATSSKATLKSSPFKTSNSEHISMFSLDSKQLHTNLEQVPIRGTASMKAAKAFYFPNADGSFDLFSVFEAPTFSATLSAKYPNIKSFVGYSKSGATIRFSKDSRGIQATITNPNKPTTYIQFLENSATDYVVYTSEVQESNLDDYVCETISNLSKNNQAHLSTSISANDQLLRKYRLAVSATGEFTAHFGGTVANALAAINATMTRVNMIFETDVAVTFEIQDFDQLIYTDAETDPYSEAAIGSDSDKEDTLDGWNIQLQNTLTATIGNTPYDIGHLFALKTGGGKGNAGCIGCVCVNDDAANNLDKNKGSGYSASSNPAGDRFDLLVAHEFGHQMGANHTFSHQTETGTNTNSEPGSGSTIMSYAGSTGNDNVQLDKDPYFHYHSIRQIKDNFLVSDCWQNNNPITLTNNPPIADAGNDYTIPQGTAYVLRGTATDGDATDVLTYCWEGTDSGYVRYWSFGPTNKGTPMARSLPPSLSPNRYIPNLSRVATNKLTETDPTTASAWETVATVGRTINYALTVRDRAPDAVGLGGITSYDTMQITVDETSGPFKVTSQSSFEEWYVDTQQTITWDVAGTDGGAINTPTVNILLSIDNGQSFPFVLASEVPNNGSAIITVPSVGEPNNDYSARVIVEGHNNIFFAMNTRAIYFRERAFSLTPNTELQQVCAPEEGIFKFTYNTYLGFTGETTFSTELLPEGVTATFNPPTATANNTEVTLTLTDTDNIDNGVNYPYYSFYAVGIAGENTNIAYSEAIIFDSNFVMPTTIFPENNAIDTDRDLIISWNVDYNAEAYLLEIATDEAFTNTVFLGEAVNYGYQSVTSELLERNTQYFWRVRPSNTCYVGDFSEIFTFTTESCLRTASEDTPISITYGVPEIYKSVINVTEDFTIDDINVKINVSHARTGELIISLTNPAGTTVVLSNTNGGGYSNYTNTIFDQEASANITSGFPPFTGTFIPEESLSQFYGTSSLGQWTLTVEDTELYYGGVLRLFELYMCDNTALSTSTFANPEDLITVYPNPSNGNFTITSSVLLNHPKINVYDITGKSVLKFHLKNKNSVLNENISTHNLESGIYLLEINDGSRKVIKKLIIE